MVALGIAGNFKAGVTEYNIDGVRISHRWINPVHGMFIDQGFIQPPMVTDTGDIVTPFFFSANDGNFSHSGAYVFYTNNGAAAKPQLRYGGCIPVAAAEDGHGNVATVFLSEANNKAYIDYEP